MADPMDGKRRLSDMDADTPPIGQPYPLYDAPSFESFGQLVASMGDTGPDAVAFELPGGGETTYRRLAEMVAAERTDLNREGAGRFVEVRDADPVRFAARFLACVSSGRCAVLCKLDEGPRRAMLAGEVPAGVCAIAASSGTSGAPKAVMLTERGILADLAAGLRLYRFAQGARYAKLLPYTHAFGLVCDLLAPLATGGTIAVPHSAPTFAAELPALAPTALNLPPRAAALLAGLLEGGDAAGGEQGIQGRGRGSGAADSRNEPSRRLGHETAPTANPRHAAYRLPTLRKILCGGAGLSAGVTRRLRMQGIEAFGCYGLTECSPCVSVNRDGWHKDGSCGVTLGCNEVSVAPSGELLVRGANVMAGYLGAPGLTSERLGGGWLHTGDVGRIDSDGFLFVDGRLDDLIVLASGVKVAPEPLERVLEAHPAVDRALVYGAPAGRAGEGAVLACKVVMRGDAGPREERDVRDYAQNLPAGDGAFIEQVVLQREPLPCGPGGKLLRRRAR